MSRSDSPEGGQTSGGYKSKSPSTSYLEAWRRNVTPSVTGVLSLAELQRPEG
jgi:hypothetical protein